MEAHQLKPPSQKLRELPIRAASQKDLDGIIAEVVKLESTRRAAMLYLWYGEPELGDELAALLAGEDNGTIPQSELGKGGVRPLIDKPDKHP